MALLVSKNSECRLLNSSRFSSAVQSSLAAAVFTSEDWLVILVLRELHLKGGETISRSCSIACCLQVEAAAAVSAVRAHLDFDATPHGGVGSDGGGGRRRRRPRSAQPGQQPLHSRAHLRHRQPQLLLPPRRRQQVLPGGRLRQHHRGRRRLPGRLRGAPAGAPRPQARSRSFWHVSVDDCSCGLRHHRREDQGRAGPHGLGWGSRAHRLGPHSGHGTHLGRSLQPRCYHRVRHTQALPLGTGAALHHRAGCGFRGRLLPAQTHSPPRPERGGDRPRRRRMALLPHGIPAHLRPHVCSDFRRHRHPRYRRAGCAGCGSNRLLQRAHWRSHLGRVHEPRPHAGPGHRQRQLPRHLALHGGHAAGRPGWGRRLHRHQALRPLPAQPPGERGGAAPDQLPALIMRSRNFRCPWDVPPSCATFDDSAQCSAAVGGTG